MWILLFDCNIDQLRYQRNQAVSGKRADICQAATMNFENQDVRDLDEPYPEIEDDGDVRRGY